MAITAAAAGLAGGQEGPEQVGRWGPVLSAEIVPIHSFLLPSGKILYWDRHDNGGHDRMGRIWDPVTKAIVHTPDPGYDLFCSGHSYLRDGRILVSGGHIMDFVGEDGIKTYDPKTGTFDANFPKMNAGRWYPSNATLPNGDVLIVAGDMKADGDANPIPQVLQVRTRTLRTLDSANLKVPWYPFLYVADNDRVFMAGAEAMTRFLDLRGRGRWIEVGNTNSRLYRGYGSSVMYSPGKVFVCGGGLDEGAPTASAEIIDINQASPKWSFTDSMKSARRQHTATVMPDGKVIVTGGTSSKGFNNSTGAVYNAEMWDPATGKWTLWARSKTVRIYHSFSLLLPDGRILTGGGGHPSDASRGDQNHPDFEIFEPPYLFKGARPAIDSAADTLWFGGEFPLHTRNQGNLQVTLLKLAAVTHAFNQNQNFNRLPWRRNGPSTLAVQAPVDSVQTQPGPHLLFLLDSAGVPSVGKVVWVNTGAGPNAIARDARPPKSALGGGKTAVRADGRHVRIPAAVPAWRRLFRRP